MHFTALFYQMPKKSLVIGIFKVDKLTLGQNSVSDARTPDVSVDLNKCLDYVPSDDVDTAGHSGTPTRQASRTLEVREILCILPGTRLKTF
jgi:hypothetical protein